MFYDVIINDKGYSGLNPVEFGFEDCENDSFYGPAIRTYWLIHFVVSGSGIFRIDGKEYQLKPGEMFIIPPYVETYYEANALKPWNYIWVGFTTDSPLPKDLPHILNLPEAAEIFNAMKNCENFSEGRSAYLSARLWDLFAFILGKEKKQSEYVNTSLDLIHSQYMTDITIDKIANRLNIDRTYLYTLFKKKLGISPKQYLFNHRMSIAASLLRDQSSSVATVARSVGYSNMYIFSKMFKQHFGISPSQYAKKED